MRKFAILTVLCSSVLAVTVSNPACLQNEKGRSTARQTVTDSRECSGTRGMQLAANCHSVTLPPPLGSGLGIAWANCHSAEFSATVA